MKIYVAGSTKDIPRSQKVIDWCLELGHKITYDWTRAEQNLAQWAADSDVSPELALEIASKERKATRTADVVVLLWHPKLLGGLLEAGMALAWHRGLCVVGPERRSIFWHLNEVDVLENDDELKEYLRGLAGA